MLFTPYERPRQNAPPRAPPRSRATAFAAIGRAAEWQVVERWRLTGSYTWLQAALDTIAIMNTTSPEHQFQIRSSLDLVFRPRESLKLGVWGVNLLARRHLEFTSPQSTPITEIPRGVTGEIIWRF